MASLTLLGPRVEVAEFLENLADEIRDEENAEPSAMLKPDNSALGAFYIEYDTSSADIEEAGVTYILDND